MFIRGVALDEAIGRMSFPSMLLRLWRGDAPSEAEADLMGACLVAAIDHGPLAPSALVARTIASTRATPMSALAGGILSFGELHGAVVTSRDADHRARVPPDGDLDDWADGDVRGGARRRPPAARASAIAGTPTTCARSGCSRSRAGSRWRGTRRRSGRSPPGSASHVGHPVAVNIDGALAVALTALRLDPEYGDFLFAIARSFGLAAHIVEERDRERPMRLIDPTAAFYDGVPVPDSLAQETDR